MAEFVRLEVEDGVGTIRLDRPPMNAINEQLARELGEVAGEAAARDDVGACVIWGGEKVFAAGADVKMMVDMGPAEIRPVIQHLQEVFNAVEDLPVVTIAAVTGYALGGGCELAMCADFRFAAEDARIGQPEILLGIIPGAGGTQRLPRLVGQARAKDMIYSGRQVGAEEALAIGLVDRVVAPGGVYREAVDAARRYARGPRVALSAAKVAVNWGARADLRTGLGIERDLFSELFSTEDQKEGMRSFVEKGPGKATFKGR
ncbi:MAG TPA: enoyl-CoA hydratase-related protein [Actinomycetota bacterium]|jgi:enoyl-CoA hydratase/carnithine racemase|nr:enoyl-CoA hydratase-related protein [Actinomycetota bacterium]